jgi:hypothetical protein
MNRNTVRFPRWIHALALGWCLSLVATPCLYAQASCTAYEREMQVYFERYRPGDAIPMARIEQAWERCSAPTETMQLIYYYFKSVQALQSLPTLGRTAYLDAAHYYYDRCVPHFSSLINPEPENAAFTDQFIDRAHMLESTLRREERRLGINPNQRYGYQPTDPNRQVNWLKDDLKPNYTSGSILDRGQGRRVATELTFNKRVRQGDTYEPQSSLRTDPARVNTAKGEAYGTVGSLSALDMMAYLRWRNQYRPVGAPDNSNFKNGGTYTYSRRISDDYGGQAYASRGQAYASPAQRQAVPRGNQIQPRQSTTASAPATPAQIAPANQRVASGQTRGAAMRAAAPNISTTPTNVRLMVNILAPSPLRERPDGNATTIGILEFGEPLDILVDENAVMANGVPYVKARTADGQTGWVERLGLIPDGRLAVAIQRVVCYAAPNGNQPVKTLAPGDEVVLADLQNQWIKLVTRNGEHQAWAYGRGGFSIDANDIAITDAYQEARMLASPQARNQKLMGIRQMPGYASSPLRSVVEAYIQQQ